MKGRTNSFALSAGAVALAMLSPAPHRPAVGAPAAEETAAVGVAAALEEPFDLDLGGRDREEGGRAETPTICPAGRCPEEPEEPLICEMQQELERKRDEILCEPRPLHPELMARRSVVYRIVDERVAGLLDLAASLTAPNCDHLGSCSRIGPEWI